MEEVERELAQPEVWKEPEKAQALSQERSSLKTVVDGLNGLVALLSDAEELSLLVSEESDYSALEDIDHDLDVGEDELALLEFRRMFQGDLDVSNAYLDIQAGTLKNPTAVNIGPRCCFECIYDGEKKGVFVRN